MNEPAYVAATLAWCNARRKEQGKRALKRLPKGMRRNARSCPCGKASGLSVWVQFAYDSRQRAVPVPRAVGRFIRAFDAGRLPQYEAKT